MKKTLSILCLAMIGLWLTALRPAPESFEGLIRYDVSLTGEAPKALADKLSKYYVLRFKGDDLQIKGGIPMKGEILVKKSLGKLYILRTDRQRIYQLDLKDKRILRSNTKPTVTRLNETLTIAGFTCQKYLVDYNGSLKQYIWTTQDINTQGWEKSPVFQSQFLTAEGVEGFPLKIQLESPQFTLTSTATAVRSSAMSASDFILPSDFALKNL